MRSELASCADGYLNETKAAARGCVCLPGLSSARRRCAGSSVIRRRALLILSGAQKNGLRLLRSRFTVDGTTGVRAECAICPAAIARVYLEFEVRRVQCQSCGTVKRERLEFLADNPFYTKRFAYYVGRRCRSATIKDIAAGAEARLGHGQGAGEAVHARAAGQGRNARAEGDRHRRDLDPQRPHLSHRGERPDPADGRSGSAARIARRRAWRSSTTGWARRRPTAFGWR